MPLANQSNIFFLLVDRGTEKWEILDEKMAVLLPLDDRLSKVMAKLEETDAKVSEIQRKIGSGLQASLPVEAPLFSEFTSRGVLSALKDIEIKVNKMASPAVASAGPGSNRKEEREMQQKTLDVVNDVAGKVDFILDKMQVVKRQSGGKQREQSVDEAPEDVYDDGDSSDYPSAGPSSAGDGGAQAERSFVKLWRRMLQPVRRANKRFETLDKVLTQLDKMANSSSVARRDDRELRDDVAALLECCRGNDAGVRGLARSVEALGETIRAGQTDENRCAAESDLQARLQHTKGELVRQLGDLFKEQISAGVERIRHTCVGQRKKSLAVHGSNGSNGTSVISRYTPSSCSAVYNNNNNNIASGSPDAARKSRRPKDPFNRRVSRLRSTPAANAMRMNRASRQRRQHPTRRRLLLAKLA